MIPTEIGLTSYRVAHYKYKENEKQLRLNLNLIDKVRMDVEQRVAHYKNLMTKHHDTMVKPRQFNSTLDTSSKEGCLWLLRILLVESWDLIGKDHTELSSTKNEDCTIWKPWMDKG